MVGWALVKIFVHAHLTFVVAFSTMGAHQLQGAMHGNGNRNYQHVAFESIRCKEESDELRDLKGNAIFVGEFSATSADRLG